MIRLPDDVSPQAGPRKPGRTLADLAPGEAGVVAEVAGDESIRIRLMEFGFLPGGRVHVVRRAPFGCPVEVDLEGARYSLRLETARGVRLLGHD